MQKTCPCGALFVPKTPTEQTRKKYCSKKCFYKFRKIPIWNKGLKGIHLSPSSEFKKGIHYSPETEFKKGNKPQRPIQKGQRVSPQTEFKKDFSPWNKGKQCPEIQGDKHWSFTTGKGSYVSKMQRIKEPICELCGFIGVWRRTIHVHHKDKNRDNNNLTNLQILCRKCHANLHKNWLLRKKLKKLVA